MLFQLSTGNVGLMWLDPNSVQSVFISRFLISLRRTQSEPSLAASHVSSLRFQVPSMAKTAGVGLAACEMGQSLDLDFNEHDDLGDEEGVSEVVR